MYRTGVDLDGRNVLLRAHAELIGVTDSNAADWARLAARDWTGYIADRAR